MVLLAATYDTSWLPLIASFDVDDISPSATFVIFLLPASIPVLVMDGPFVMVMPSVVMVVSPTLTVLAFTVVIFPVSAVTVFVVTVSNPFRSLDKRTFRLLLPSDVTPILSSAVSLDVSEIPPMTLTCSFSFLLITAPVSPPYFMPSFMVATVWVWPLWSS